VAAPAPSGRSIDGAVLPAELEEVFRGMLDGSTPDHRVSGVVPVGFISVYTISGPWHHDARPTDVTSMPSARAMLT
jgi:hypothetical protein